MSKPLAVFSGRVTDGRLEVPVAAIRDAARGWADGSVLLVVQTAHRDRSLPQLRYYRGVVLPAIAEATGQDEDAIHEDMIARFLPPRHVAYVNPTTGEVDERAVPRRTSGLSVGEYSDFVDRVCAWCGEWLGLIIPAAALRVAPPEPDPLPART